jgi:hypothetical protein
MHACLCRWDPNGLTSGMMMGRKAEKSCTQIYWPLALFAALTSLQIVSAP